MRLLVGIEGNAPEWAAALVEQPDKPRLPLPYMFGVAFVRSGHQLEAVDFSTSFRSQGDSAVPFRMLYGRRQLTKAIKSTDATLLWSTRGIAAAPRQALLSAPRRRLVLASYVWSFETLPSIPTWLLALATRSAAWTARGVVLMTDEQASQARSFLPPRVFVRTLTWGVDTKFYRAPVSLSDVPDGERDAVERLLVQPYVILPGDQLRCDRDALDLVLKHDLRLARVPQSAATAEMYRQEIRRHGLERRCFLFERASYPLLRFLLRNASCYAGLVDSRWQPAGWTVACEALASGLPGVVYEGLVARELKRLGAGKCLQSVVTRDLGRLAERIQEQISRARELALDVQARQFASTHLDMEASGGRFVEAIVNALESRG